MCNKLREVFGVSIEDKGIFIFKELFVWVIFCFFFVFLGNIILEGEGVRNRR